MATVRFELEGTLPASPVESIIKGVYLKVSPNGEDIQVRYRNPVHGDLGLVGISGKGVMRFAYTQSGIDTEDGRIDGTIKDITRG